MYTNVPPDDVISVQVLKKLQAGDSNSFEKVYLHWRKPIHKFVFNMVGIHSDAEDITQEIFTTLWNYRKKVDPEQNIRSLLFLLARRAIYNNHRAQIVRERYIAESLWMEESTNFTSHDLVVEKEAELIKQVALERMPPQQRKIYEMTQDEDMTADAIASQLNIKKETVYNQLSRAKKEIRHAIEEYMVFFIL